MFKKLLALFIIIVVSDSYANSQAGIIAKVNNDVITSSEFQARKASVTFLNKVGELSEQEDRLFNRNILHQLIDENLINQESTKLGIKVSEKKIDDAIATIEKRNNLEPGSLLKSIKERGIPTLSFRNQIKSELQWNMIVSEMIQKNVIVADSEVASAIDVSNSKDSQVLFYQFESKDQKHLRKVRSSVKTCDNLQEGAYDKYTKVSKVETMLSSLHTLVQGALRSLAINDTSSITLRGDHYQFMMLCKRNYVDVSDQERLYVLNTIGNNKVGLKAKKYKDSLRKKAYIKVM